MSFSLFLNFVLTVALAVVSLVALGYRARFNEERRRYSQFVLSVQDRLNNLTQGKRK